jgi:hypothetical protein
VEIANDGKSGNGLAILAADESVREMSVSEDWSFAEENYGGRGFECFCVECSDRYGAQENEIAPSLRGGK